MDGAFLELGFWKFATKWCHVDLDHLDKVFNHEQWHESKVKHRIWDQLIIYAKAWRRLGNGWLSKLRSTTSPLRLCSRALIKCGVWGMSFVEVMIWMSLGIGSGNVVRHLFSSVGNLVVWGLSMVRWVWGLSVVGFFWCYFLHGNILCLRDPATPRDGRIFLVLNALSVGFVGDLSHPKTLKQINK